jgi:hypothetical protein
MQKRFLPFLFAVLLAPLSGFSQDFSYSNVSLKTVSFSGSLLTIRKDDGSGSYAAPHWNTGAAKQDPVAYVSGSKPRVAATLAFTCTNALDSIWVRGMGSDSISFSAQHVAMGTPAGSVYTINYPATDGSSAFASSIVRFYKPFTIDWEISFDGAKWYPGGTSANTLYVTRSMPQSETSNFKYWETVYDLSCRNADMQSADTAIISHVFNEFVDHVVLNVDDDSLFYYKIMNSPNVTLSSLLMYHDAECYTFAQLFLAAIKIQGVVRSSNYVYITPDGTPYCTAPAGVNRFLVKNWVFGTPSASSTCAEFPYENTYTTLLPAPYTAYSFITADVTDQTGIPGSCTANPSSYFNNHQIAKLDGKYYDACYGVTFNALTDIKTAAFDGWSFRVTGSTTHAYFTPDLSKANLTESITTW